MSSRSILIRIRRLVGARSAQSRQRLSVFLWSSLVAILVSTAFALGWFEGFELKTIDWRTRLHAPIDAASESPIAIVAITENDLRVLGESWPLPRERYAQLIDVLHRQGAAVIALDMVLPATPRSAEGDRALAEACRRAGNVVLATYSPEPPANVRAGFDAASGRHKTGRMLGNAPDVTKAAAAIGHLNIFTDTDGTVRRVPAVIEHNGGLHLPLGTAAAAVYSGRLDPQEWVDGATDGHGCFWISYRDLRDAIDFREDGGLLRQAGIDLNKPIELYYLRDVLGRDAGMEERALDGKIVLVGCVLDGFASSQHTTPFGRQHGVFVQAAILDTALNGGPLTRIPWAVSALVTALVTIASGILFSRLEGHWTAIGYGLALAIIIGTSVLAFRYYRFVVDITPPVTAVTLSCGGALLIGLGLARVEVAKRNRELDVLLEAGTASVALVGPELTGSDAPDSGDPGGGIIGSVEIPEKTPQIVANTFGQAMRAGGCLLCLRKKRSKRLILAASYGFGAGLGRTQCMSTSGALNAHILDAGRPLLIRKPHTKHIRCTLPAQVKSVLLVPLTIGGQTIGTIQLFNKVPLTPGDDGMFSQDDLRTATILGCQSAVSLQNARLYLERHDLFLDFVEAVATSVDLKDRYTHGHSKRVAEHSAGIAAELGLSKAQIELVALAARLHDVGKIGTPDLLLHKRGRLSQREFEVIKAHTTNAERLFRGRPGWRALVPAIRHHHERFNSTGYPDGLRGNQIPIAARIIAVADAFDAMTSDRPYRSRMAAGEACEEVKACSGTQFDPRVAAAFLRRYREALGDGAVNARRGSARAGTFRPLGAAAG